MDARSADGYRRAALFVDFENVHMGLSESSEEAAQRFATEPARWVQWMEDVLGPLLVDLGDQPRKLLRRICYLEPRRSGKFRPFFTRAGFRVVDCPTLTGWGKNSADIHMVLDILDTLAHPAHYDEFILLSVDADFTPVLLRLREHDRRTAMLLSGPAAGAMQAACDFVIPESVFLDEALGLETEEEPAAAAAPARTTPPDVSRLRDQMREVVRQVVAEASEPVPLAPVAHELRQRLGPQVDTTRWAGSGSFGKFLAQIADEHLAIDRSRAAGFAYDPTRHTVDSEQALNLPEVATRVGRIVDVPRLSSEAYATLFQVIATEARTTGPHAQPEAERVARDRCAAQGVVIPRAAVRFVLQGYHYSGVDWRSEELDAPALAAAFADNVVRLALAAQMELNDTEQAELRRWIVGGLNEPSPDGQPLPAPAAHPVALPAD